MPLVCISFLTAALALTTTAVHSARIDDKAGFFNHDNEKLCFDKLGCLITTDDWYSAIHRPLNLSPAKREDVGVIFTLYTRANKSGEVITVNDKEEVTTNLYKGERKTKFITHGFLGSAKADWVMGIMEALLTRMDINVITVDWSKGAGIPYNQAVVNTRVVGMEIAYLINTLLKTKGGSADDFHLIGHSLGAQSSGYAGERVEGLGRITGLDPAGPMFTKMPNFVRLDPSDAKFVDVIHTDAELMGFGIEEAVGHVDFFPNGGNSQPGCSIPLKMDVMEMLNAMGDAPSCSHSRSELLFLESITSSPYYDAKEGGDDHACPFTSFLCDSYEDFLKGDCTSCGENGLGCALMGIDSDKYPGKNEPLTKPRKFFLKTNPTEPFCGYHYAVNLTLAAESKGRNTEVGDLVISAYGDKVVANKMDITESGARKMEKGKSYNFLGFSPNNVGRVSKADVTWKWNPSLLSSDTCIFCVKDLFLSYLEVSNLGFYPGKEFKVSASCKNEEPFTVKNGVTTPLNLKC